MTTPRWVTRRYVQTATYWASPVPTGEGTWTFTAPVALDVRWRDVEEHFVSDGGEDLISKATVMADQEFKGGEYLYLGTSVATDPTQVDGARRVEKKERTPSVRGQFFVNKAWLV